MSTKKAVEAAFDVGRDMVQGGDGFQFTVTLNNGHSINGIPPSTDDLQARDDDVLALELGDGDRMAHIPYASILWIETIKV
jgi:hypothetical protein